MGIYYGQARRETPKRSYLQPDPKALKPGDRVRFSAAFFAQHKGCEDMRDVCATVVYAQSGMLARAEILIDGEDRPRGIVQHYLTKAAA
mgnify:CR=1 FL=1